MPVPLDLAIALGLLGAVALAPFWVAVGAKLERMAQDAADLKPQVLSAMREIEQWEQPRLLEWSPETVARFRAQQIGRR